MKAMIKDVIKSLGVVFGDIGTSPIYTFSVAFTLAAATPANILGISSLIIWTLILLVTVQYAWLAMSIGDKGEGGTIVLKEFLVPLLRSSSHVSFVTLLSFLGISFFIGDGVITPAISVLSAVEGLELITVFRGLPREFFIIIACFISIILFVFQKRGTERMSAMFGPIMLVWFLFLGISGFLFILQYPIILKAINPWYAFYFLTHNGLVGFLLLSKVILCATGGEALYADMGHLGRKPIIYAWHIAFTALCLTYLGQGAFLLSNPAAGNIFYEMILHQFNFLYVPLLLLSIIATVIASQAMISGIFSIVYQGIMTHILPRLSVEYTSMKFRSSIYIPFINWSLLTLVLCAIIKFKYAHNLANAYGLAASGTMTITAVLLVWIFYIKKDHLKLAVSLIVTAVNFLYLASNMFKIPYGGYWSLLVASIPLTLILIYTGGQRKLYKSLQPLPLRFFLEEYNTILPTINPIKGQAVFFVKSIKHIPTYMDYTMFVNNIIYEENIVVAVTIQEKAFGVTGKFIEDLAPRLRIFEIKAGYMEILNLEKILNSTDIQPKVIFYGVEDIITKNIVWKIFTVIKKLTPSFVQFYKLPADKLHGVTVRVEI
jgi:KUP system potassium uptake protein